MVMKNFISNWFLLVILVRNNLMIWCTLTMLNTTVIIWAVLLLIFCFCFCWVGVGLRVWVPNLDLLTSKHLFSWFALLGFSICALLCIFFATCETSLGYVRFMLSFKQQIFEFELFKTGCVMCCNSCELVFEISVSLPPALISFVTVMLGIWKRKYESEIYNSWV